MSTIIILGDRLTISQAHECHDHLVNYHFRIVPSRFQWELEALVIDPPIHPNPKSLGEDYEAYKTTIKRLEDKYPIWSIYDHRLVFFLPQFARLVKNAGVLWNDTYPKDKANDEYVKNLQKLNKEVFEAFEGEKLHLTKEGDREAIRGLLLRLAEKEKAEAEKK